jgi:outer membrane murein-binding lipoprotein Lpp
MQQIEQVTVLPTKLVEARKAITDKLEFASSFTASFFGADEPGADEILIVEKSTAMTLLSASANELTLAGTLSIKNVDQYVACADDLKRIKGLQKEVEGKRKALAENIDAAKKEVQELFKPAQNWLDDAERAIKSAMGAFDEERRKQRQIEEARAAQAARKEQEDLLARAENHEEKGRVEVAEVLKEQAATVTAAPSIAQEAPVVKGISTRTNYSAEVTDLMALVKAVAAGQVPLVVLQPDMKVLNAQAKALKEHLTYPGVKVVASSSISARS